MNVVMNWPQYVVIGWIGADFILSGAKVLSTYKNDAVRALASICVRIIILWVSIFVLYRGGFFFGVTP